MEFFLQKSLNTETIKVLILNCLQTDFKEIKSTTPFEELKKRFMDLLNKFAHFKCKYLRAKHFQFMTKELSKSRMLCTKIRHPFLKIKKSEARAKHNK